MAERKSALQLRFYGYAAEITAWLLKRERERGGGGLLFKNVLPHDPICVKPSVCWETVSACTFFSLGMPAALPKT